MICTALNTNLTCRVHTHPLEYTTYGKPNPSMFKNAEILLHQLVQSLHQDTHVASHAGTHHFKTLYMIGDNPSVDIKGARQVCCCWIRDLVQYFIHITVCL